MGIGASVFMIAAGAILAFALEIADSTYGSVTVDWGIVGFILMVVGAVGLLWSLYLSSLWRDTTIARDERRRLKD